MAPSRPSDIDAPATGPQRRCLFPPPGPSPKRLAAFLAALLCLASPSLAAEAPEALPKGAAVTVLKAAKSCFSDIVEVSGIVRPREETAVRPERPGLKVTEILADAGDTVTAGQTLARLSAARRRQCSSCRRRWPG